MFNFGEKFNGYWPKTPLDLTPFSRKLLNQCQQIKKPEKLSFLEILKKSNELPVEFPIESCRIASQPEDRIEIIQQQAASAYPVIHSRVLWLYLRFLEHKSQYGSIIEKEIYCNMSLTDFIQRLLSKRCVTFVGFDDNYLLLDGQQGSGGFVDIGTVKEVPPLLLRNCLSYDEIKLSALLSISSYTEFLNDGNRENQGVIEKNKTKIETEGIIIGLIGGRLSRPGLMEYQDIIINKIQNVPQNGYGPKETFNANPDFEKKYDYRQVWNQFYDEEDLLFNQIQKDDKRFEILDNNDIFDNLLMKKRYTISFDTLLLESESRAAAAKKRAFIHVVGIGLGAWRCSDQQEAIFLETFSQRIKYLLPHLKHISYIHFSWFELKKCGDMENGKCFSSNEHPDGGIQVFISNRNPADKLVGPEFDNTLLIVSYAWDGNALPGNEFWLGWLEDSGDPAAACSTLISELHNPHINSTMISGHNLHVASPTLGVLHISEYAKQILNSN